jgi:hypothetical protein
LVGRSIDINDLSYFEPSEQHDFYGRQVVRNATSRHLCVDGNLSAVSNYFFFIEQAQNGVLR